MQYTLTQDFLSSEDRFTIIGDADQPAYRVRGKALAWGETLSFQAPDGTELASISQEMESRRPKFTIFRGGGKFAEITKDFSWFRSKFTLDIPGPNDYTIKGSLSDRKYTFQRSGRVVATVSKTAVALSDTYTVEIAEDDDDVAVLATVVVIDLISHNEDEV